MKFPLLKEFSGIPQIASLIEKIKNNKENISYISGLPGSSGSLLIKLLSTSEKNILVLTQGIQRVNELKVELNVLGLGNETVALDELNRETLQQRLTSISKKERLIIIAPYEILKIKLPQKLELEKNTLQLHVGAEISYEELLEYLGMYSYKKDKYVESPGDFAVRGSIIDFWSYSERQPTRVEFDGDFLESLRHFDSESQRSSDRIEEVSLAPALQNETTVIEADIFEYLDNPLIFASDYDLHNTFTEKEKKEEKKIDLSDMDSDLKEELYNNETPEENLVPEEIKADYISSDVQQLLKKDARWIIEDELGKYDNRLKLELFAPPKIDSNFEVLFKVVKEFADKGNTIFISTENEIQGKRLFDLLSEFKQELNDLLKEGLLKINVLAIKEGFHAKKSNYLVLTDYQIFNKPYRTRISTSKKYKKSRVKDFASIKHGDFVVHENFGIGQYAGLQTIKIGMVEQESIKINYAEGGVVYVNLNYLSLVKKFSSKEGSPPKLSVLGSNEWKNTKKKVKTKIKEAARELITLYAKRKSTPGVAYSPDTIWQKELEASFFYEDTPDQAKVTEEVKLDMESENPMDRLVCGDVGFGKTEIAVRAAFKAVNEGKQVGLLVPTTILAEQHLNTFRDRLTQFPVKVAALSRFQTKTVQTEIVKGLAEGKVDVVIGTHRLLSKDIKFKDLGLLIIDEEQRFGVMAKEKLRTIRANVDTLTLTATPIPRTLNLSLLGARDLSIIATPPPNRQPIYTKVDIFDIHKVRDWVLEEVKRNGQIYFVHDRVQSIDKIALYIQKYIPEINIAIAHGQMKATQLEKVIHEFLDKKYHMLLATKIIESGLDIPNVNTIIVNRADRFGLAELHQLRGRVGRSDKQAYAYFLVPSLNTITKKAVRRLQAIEEYTDLGEGFNLSMRDLEIRGAGNLLGTEQSGSIDSVGFDMYIKLVDEAVEELKETEFKNVFDKLPKSRERSETSIDTFFEIGIPKDFMPEQADRLSFYTALFSINKWDEMKEIVEELEDRFGKAPVIVERLLKTAELRYFASYALFERIIILRDRMTIILPKSDKEDFYQNKFSVFMQYIVDRHAKSIHFKQDRDVMKLEVLNRFSSPEQMLDYLIGFSKEITNQVIEAKLDEKMSVN